MSERINRHIGIHVQVSRHQHTMNCNACAWTTGWCESEKEARRIADMHYASFDYDHRVQIRVSEIQTYNAISYAALRVRCHNTECPYGFEVLNVNPRVWTDTVKSAQVHTLRMHRNKEGSLSHARVR